MRAPADADEKDRFPRQHRHSIQKLITVSSTWSN